MKFSDGCSFPRSNRAIRPPRAVSLFLAPTYISNKIKAFVPKTKEIDYKSYIPLSSNEECD